MIPIMYRVHDALGREYWQVGTIEYLPVLPTVENWSEEMERSR